MSIKTSIWDNGTCKITVEGLTVNKMYSINSNETPNEIKDVLRKICKYHCVKLNLTNIIDIKYCYNDSARQVSRHVKSEKNIKFKLIFFIDNINDNCLICTDKDYEDYKYKNFSNINNQNYSINIYRQKIGNHICVDPNIYIYSNTKERIRSLDVYVYADISDKLTAIQNEESTIVENTHRQVFVEEKLNYSYYNDILYNNKYRHDFVEEIISQDKCECFAYKLLNKPEVDNSCELVNSELNTLKSLAKPNRFVHCFVYNNAFDKTTCNWILTEFLKICSNNYIYDLNKFPMTYDYTLFALSSYILPFINNSYNVDKTKYIININYIKIINATDDFYIKLVDNTDDNDNFSISILLSDANDVSNDYYKFQDGTEYNIKQGDAIIFYTNLKCKKYKVDKPLYILTVKFTINMIDKENRVL
jgi:hypothetical protein